MQNYFCQFGLESVGLCVISRSPFIHHFVYAFFTHFCIHVAHHNKFFSFSKLFNIHWVISKFNFLLPFLFFHVRWYKHTEVYLTIIILYFTLAIFVPFQSFSITHFHSVKHHDFTIFLIYWFHPTLSIQFHQSYLPTNYINFPFYTHMHPDHSDWSHWDLKHPLFLQDNFQQLLFSFIFQIIWIAAYSQSSS